MESSIKFNEKYYNKIWDGRKVSAIRLGGKGFEVGDKFKAVFVNDKGEAYSGVSAFCPLTFEVTRVIETRVKYLTDYDACVDGFDNVIELFEDLSEYYQDLRLNDTVCIIYFKKGE